MQLTIALEAKLHARVHTKNVSVPHNITTEEQQIVNKMMDTALNKLRLEIQTLLQLRINRSTNDSPSIRTNRHGTTAQAA